MAHLTLQHFGESSASYRVRIALGLKRLEFESVLVNIRRGEHRQERYAKINPQRLVPCLQVGDDLALGQSVAIVEYLEEVWPTPTLLPESPADRALARSIVQQIACDVSPFQKTTVQEHLRDPFGLPDARIDDWLNLWMHRGLGPVERYVGEHLANQGYLFGSRPGIVECALVPQLYNLRKWGVGVDAFPALVQLEERCLDQPAFMSAHPQRWQ